MKHLILLWGFTCYDITVGGVAMCGCRQININSVCYIETIETQLD